MSIKIAIKSQKWSRNADILHKNEICHNYFVQIYTCFSCGATGNVFKFIMDYENISFMEAVKVIASKGGIDVDVNTFTPKKVVKNKT